MEQIITDLASGKVYNFLSEPRQEMADEEHTTPGLELVERHTR